jgi:hypothetical protein
MKQTFLRVGIGTAVLLALAVAALRMPMTTTVYGAGGDDATGEAYSHQAAAKYCVSKGGEIELRTPFYGTNNPNPLRLDGSRYFCQFTAKDGSRIHLLLTTLYSTQPSLAALAYYAQVPLGTGCTGNPASCYCSLLGGTDLFGGINAAGGSWVLKGAIDEDLEACIFPDLSSIDSWGLAYHSAGIIRGRDLSKVLRYKNPN